MVGDGLLAGVIGALVVAAWFLVLDTLQGRPFYTPSLLGSVIFLGARVEQVTSVDVTMVFAYTGLHSVLFLGAGTAVAWAFSAIQKYPQMGIILVLLFVLFEAVLFGFEVTIVPRLVGVLGAIQVALANVLAAVGMFWFLLLRHPLTIERLKQGWHQS